MNNKIAFEHLLDVLGWLLERRNSKDYNQKTIEVLINQIKQDLASLQSKVFDSSTLKDTISYYKIAANVSYTKNDKP